MPRRSEKALLTGTLDLGIKMAFMYQWPCDQEMVTLFVENTPNSANMSGNRYHWDTWEEDKWYYEQVIAISQPRLMTNGANDLKMKSYITDDDRAGAAFLVDHY